MTTATVSGTSLNWRDAATSFLLKFLSGRSGALAETVVEAATTSGEVPPPPDKRSWGTVFGVAARKGLIEGDGFARAITSNNSYKPFWRKV